MKLKRLDRHVNKSLRNKRYPVSKNLRESSVPNLSDRIGKRQVQSEIPGIATIYYTIDYQNPDNFEEVAITISPSINGKVYKQTVTGWDEAFEIMGNLESSLSDAYKEGIQNLLIDFSLAISDDSITDENNLEDSQGSNLSIDYKALKDNLKSIVGGIDNYVFDSIDKEISAQGFIPI